MYLLSQRLSQQLIRTNATAFGVCCHHLRNKWQSFVVVNNRLTKRCLRASSAVLTTNSNHKPINTDINANKESNDYNKVFTFPNVLCMTRIAFTPVIGYLVIDHHFTTALTLCAIGSITDLLDGYYARRYNCVTKLGAILDPLADKLLVATLTITLTVVHLIPIWLTALILLRDSLIITGALYLMNRRLSPPKTWKRFIAMSTEMSTNKFTPTLISKINTGFQFSLVALTLAAPVFSYTDHWALTCLQLATGATTLTSGLNYLKRLRPSVK